jgi:hypothetical protein
MRAAQAKHLRSHLLQSVAVLIAAAASMSAAQAQTQTIATATNVNAINLLKPFTTLLGTPTIAQNFTNAVSINNNSTAFQRSQSIIDNTITTDNGVVLSDGLQDVHDLEQREQPGRERLYRYVLEQPPDAVPPDQRHLPGRLGQGQELAGRRVGQRKRVRQQQ